MTPKENNRAKLGKAGEKLARRYLKKLGYRHLKSNYRCDRGEIDLIMAQAETVVFVEVKTRQKENYAAGEAVVNYAKQKRIAATARQFVNKYRLEDKPLRIDVIVIIDDEINKPTVRHYENAFRV